MQRKTLMLGGGIVAAATAAGVVVLLWPSERPSPARPVMAMVEPQAAPAPAPAVPAPRFIVVTPPGEAKARLPQELIDKLQPFLAGLWPDAAQQNVSRATFDRAFAGVEMDAEILDRLTNQPELTSAPWDYVGIRVSETRIANGQAKLAEHGILLLDLESLYGVDRHIILAIWGMESNYGAMQGTHGIIRSLATLSIIDSRRPQFWRAELLKALAILERGDIAPEKMTGSWAGAMGHMQFMPSSFLAQAVDHDGDGRRDIWGSVPDALASAANYVQRAKWRPGEPWGFEVALPDGFDFGQSAPGVVRSLAEWQKLGVTRPAGMPPVDTTAPLSLLLPAGARGPAFLVTGNFRAILAYNNAVPYALAVGHLADRIAGRPAIAGYWPTDDAPLDKAGREEMQRRLARLGYEISGIDGVIGTQTRAAVRAFQKRAGLPEDGYAGTSFLKRLRQDTPN
ncbi:MAG: lytic murein transglycosylase [Hyphomicrobiaceae bacterium]